jgi:hypothetical protein
MKQLMMFIFLITLPNAAFAIRQEFSQKKSKRIYHRSSKHNPRFDFRVYNCN